MAGSMISHVMIIPDAQRAVADQTEVALGAANPGASTYQAPLSASGQLPATHWYCHRWEDGQYLAGWNRAKAGQLWPGVDWAAYGLTEPQVEAMADAMDITTRGDGQHEDHVEDALADHGLQKITPPRPGTGPSELMQ